MLFESKNIRWFLFFLFKNKLKSTAIENVSKIFFFFFFELVLMYNKTM